MTAALPTPGQDDQGHAARRAADQAFATLNPDFAARSGDPLVDRVVHQFKERELSLGERVGYDSTLGENFHQDDPASAESREAAIRWRAQAAHPSDPAEQFTRLNPDFGVLPDDRHAGQHGFAHQREAALSLGTRAAVAAMDEAHPDPQQRQAAITARTRAMARQGRSDRLRQARHDRPQPPAAAQRRVERPQRRSDRQQRGEQEEERSR